MWYSEQVKVYIEDLELAWSEYPEGRTCGFCAKPNFWADDCGFFYADRYRDQMEDGYVAICKDCWDAGGYTTAER